jgi:sugar phosphate isomerase/epimerase
MAEQMGVTLRLENMFLNTPEHIINVKKRLNSDAVKVCFDVGHFNVYSDKPLNMWLDAIETDLEEVHLHDNRGTEDDHLALGEGIIDFRTMTEGIAGRKTTPQFTIEMKSDKFEESLDYIIRNDLFAPFDLS